LKLDPWIWCALVGDHIGINESSFHGKDLHMKSIMYYRLSVIRKCKSLVIEKTIKSNSNNPNYNDNNNTNIDIDVDNIFNMDSFHKTFTITSMNNQITDLIPHGSTIPVTPDRLVEYFELCEEYMMHEIDTQINAIKYGFSSIIPYTSFTILTGVQLESLVLGHGLLPHDINQELKWIYKVVFLEGAKVRVGLELSSDVIHNIHYGSFIEVFERRINLENIPRLRTEKGWMSEMLNPAAGSVGSVAEVSHFILYCIYYVCFCLMFIIIIHI
jgi:hypothetical protein